MEPRIPSSQPVQKALVWMHMPIRTLQTQNRRRCAGSGQRERTSNNAAYANRSDEVASAHRGIESNRTLSSVCRCLVCTRRALDECDVGTHFVPLLFGALSSNSQPGRSVRGWPWHVSKVNYPCTPWRPRRASWGCHSHCPA